MVCVYIRVETACRVVYKWTAMLARKSDGSVFVFDPSRECGPLNVAAASARLRAFFRNFWRRVRILSVL